MSTTARNTQSVTIIGLGAMGQALAAALLAAGHRVTVWNRSAGKAGALVARGAQEAPSVAAAIAASDITIVCVLDYPVVKEILHPAGHALQGKTLVNLTNGTPEQARTTADWAQSQGAQYLDGGIMAIPPMIGQPGSLILYSGHSAAFEQYQPLLEVLGAARYFGTDPGLASLYDLSLLSAMYGLFAGYLHAVSLIGSEKVKAGEFTPMVMEWLSAMQQTLPLLAEQIDTRDYTKGVVSNLAMQAAAFINLPNASVAQGIRPDLLLPMKTLMDEAVAKGYGNGDISSLVEVIRRPAV